MQQLSHAQEGLRDIDDVVPLGSADAACLEEIRAVLKKYSALDRFGVSLLHRHFPVYDGEMLLETCDANARTLVMQPVPELELAGREIIGTEWRFGVNGEVVAAMSCAKACVVRNGTHERGGHVKVGPVKP